MRLSGELLVPLIERPIDEVQPIDEEILDARAIGQAHVNGQPRLTLADDPAAAAFRVTVTGTIVSRTVGRKGPVQIHSQSETRFTATKRVVFEPGRGFVGEPAEIAAETTSQTNAIKPDRGGVVGRVIERRAWARVAESREQVNQIVQAKAEAKIRESFDRLLDARLARLNRRVDQGYLIAAVLGGNDKPHYRCSTHGGSLIVAASLGETADRDQTAVDGIARSKAGPPMQVWVHEGVLGDRLAAVIRQVDITRRMLQTWSGVIPMPRAQSHHHPSRFDFAAVGDWFVVHSGAGQVVATAATVAVTVPEIPPAVAAQSVGLARPADSGGGQ